MWITCTSTSFTRATSRGRPICRRKRRASPSRCIRRRLTNIAITPKGRATGADAMSQPRIDAHQHFWRYQPPEYRWISDEMAVLKQDLLPEQLAVALQRHDIQGSVLVQACSR